MLTETHALIGTTPGLRAELNVLRFGGAGSGPKVAIQAALHADEVPALLVAQCLRERLAALEAQGQLLGEVRLLPVANPIGLGQRVLGHHEGRFDLRDGLNFNRGFSDLAARVSDGVHNALGADPAANVATLRRALREAVLALPVQTPTAHLKQQLLLNAVECDIVLDLHCDSEAVVHLYALDVHAPLVAELGARLGAQAVLLAMDSGDGPFDEACSRPWIQLQQRWPDFPIPPACFAATVELRGEADVGFAQADADAEALIRFLRARGVVAGAADAPPPTRCKATPLSASEPIHAPHAGIVVFQATPGQSLAAGDLVATLVDPTTGRRTALHTEGGGLMYARIATRWAAAGQRLAKVAGQTLRRSGNLLSA
jgi:predicted deacylase